MADGFARSTLHRGLEELRLFGFDGWSLGVGGIVLCGVWAAVPFDVPPQTTRSRITRELLRHTAICDDARVAAAITDWIAPSLGDAKGARGATIL